LTGYLKRDALSKTKSIPLCKKARSGMIFGGGKHPHLKESPFRDDFRRWKASSFERKLVPG